MAGDTFQIEAGRSATSVEVNTATIAPSRGIYIGVAGDYDFNINGTWYAFTGTLAGSILPIQATGARHNSGSTAPDAGDIVFLH